MTRGGWTALKMMVALVAAIGAGACRDDRVTLAVARDGASAGDAADGSDEGDAPAAVDAPDGGLSDADVFDGPEHNDAPPGVWIDRTPCVIPADTPVYRQYPMTAFDSDRRKVLVFGGEGAAGHLTDFWELDVATATWTSRIACDGAVLPETTAFSLPLYDHARRRFVLFLRNEGVVLEWAPDTGAWTKRVPAAGMPVPSGDLVAAVYDDARGKALVFAQEALPEIDSGKITFWEWEGDTGVWLLRVDGVPPWIGGDFPSVAFDSGRDAVWMFGGNSSIDDHLWRLDVATGTITDLTPAVRPADWPPARVTPELVYDGARGRLVLLGGGRSAAQRDLWELDPATTTWRNRTPPNVPIIGSAMPAGVPWPTGEFGGGLFADAASGRLVHVSTTSPSALALGLWIWDSVSGTWSDHEYDPVLRWPYVSLERLTAWDGGRGKLLTYDPAQRELWQWGTGVGRWDRFTPAGIVGYSNAPDPVPWPSGRMSTAVAWDPGARRLVIFAGSDYYGTATYGDLWIWDPATAQMTSPPRPATGWPRPRFSHAMAYDPVRRRVLMFGGSVPEAVDELWALDTAAVRWERVTPAGDWPSARSGHVLVLDEDRGVLVLQGGQGGADIGALSDTWELAAGASAWQRRAADGPPGLRPQYTSFVHGLGVVAMAAKSDGETSAYHLWKWDPAAAAWVAAGVDPPRPLPVDDVYSAEATLAGGGDTLFMLPPASSSRPLDEQAYAETWEWRAP